MAKFSEFEILFKTLKFRTEYNSNQSFKKLSLSNSFLFLGSCFAENIGNKLLSLKVDGHVNPLGITYNPLSLAKILACDLEGLLSFNRHEKDINFNFQLHSEFNHTDSNQFQSNIKKKYALTQQCCSNCENVFISLGTAWYYKLKENGVVVNNCHKQNPSIFDKKLLSLDECIESLKTIVNHFKQSNIIFTISPIRHLKDGFRENTLSKSILHLAVERICTSFENVSYFPSYELLLDDLRDYRYYENDLIHPNEQGIEYIWNYFMIFYFSKNDQQELNDRDKLLKSVYHKPFLPKSQKHQEFLKSLLEKLEMQSQLFASEIKHVKSQLIS